MLEGRRTASHVESLTEEEDGHGLLTTTEGKMGTGYTVSSMTVAP